MKELLQNFTKQIKNAIEIAANSKLSVYNAEIRNIVLSGMGGSGITGALRFRQQLNENSKMLCWHNVFPELNHNELQGWKQKKQQHRPCLV